MNIDKLYEEIKKKDSFPFLVSDITNIRYLTGFSGSYAFLLIDRGSSIFLTDTRYAEYAEGLLDGSGITLSVLNGSYTETLAGIAEDFGWTTLHVEDNAVTFAVYNELTEALGITILPGGDPVRPLREVKSKRETDILREAARITDACISHLASFIRTGMTEWDIVTELTHFYMQNGCDGTSFDPIVASGPGSSMPHYRSSRSKKVEYGDVLLIDMGCLYEGYNSDLTRTFFVGYVDSEFEKIYSVVNTARRHAVEAARPGITAAALDSVARTYIQEAGYGECFGHSLGHGVGLDIHESPRLKSGNDEQLRAGYTITIEPGIYLTGKGGVRIEDMVLVTEDGPEILTTFPRDIVIL
ncbi:MAG: M24 family metallopeptidase [Spirochaetota bacterium]